MSSSGYGGPGQGSGGYDDQQPRYGNQYNPAPQSGPPQYGPRPQQGYTNNPYGRSPVTYEFGVVGTVVAAVGAILAVISFTATDWFKGGGSFSDVGDALDAGGASAGGLATAYFGWLAWLLLVLAAILAIAACSPSPAAQALRAIGAIVAAIGIAVTFFAIRLGTTGSYTDYLKDARIGFYFALAGFVLIGVGALIGPRRREG